MKDEQLFEAFKAKAFTEVEPAVIDEPTGTEEPKEPEATADTDTDPEIDPDEEETAVVEPEPEAKPATAEPAPVVTPEPVVEKMHTQADMDKMAGRIRAEERQRREQDAKRIRDIQVVAGVPLETLVEQLRQQRIEGAQNQFAMSEEEARQHVAANEELQFLKSERAQAEAERQSDKRLTAYQQSKLLYLNDTQADPALKAVSTRFDAEIDQFSTSALAQGNEINYELARDYVLGTKLPEILKERELAIEQRVLANIEKRSKVAPLGTNSGAPQGAPALSVEERQVARAMGVSEKAYAARKAEQARDR